MRKLLRDAKILHYHPKGRSFVYRTRMAEIENEESTKLNIYIVIEKNNGLVNISGAIYNEDNAN